MPSALCLPFLPKMSVGLYPWRQCATSVLEGHAPHPEWLKRIHYFLTIQKRSKKPELIKKPAPSPPLWIQTPQSWGSFFPSFLGGKLGVSEVLLTPHGHTHSSQPLSGPEVCLSTSKIQPFPTIDTCSGKDHSWSSSGLFSLRNGKSNGWLPWTTARSAGLFFLNLS